MSDEHKNSGDDDGGVSFDGGLVLPGDAGFDQVQQSGEPFDGDGLEADEYQTGEIREIFGTAFPQYLLPVEEIVDRILSGELDEESLDTLDATINSLLEASAKMGFDDINILLRQLQTNLIIIDVNAEVPVTEELAAAILNSLDAIKNLASEMSSGQALSSGAPAQTILSALRDKEGVDQLALRRLSAAGLVTVDQLLWASHDEITAVSGLSSDTVKIILDYLKKDHADDPAKSYANSAQAKPNRVASTVEDGKKVINISPSLPVREPSGEVSKEIESLHEDVISQLRKEGDVEAELDAQKADMKELHKLVEKKRYELHTAESMVNHLRKELGQISKQTAEREASLASLGAQREALLQKYTFLVAETDKSEIILEGMKKQWERTTNEVAAIRENVDGMVDALKRITRSAANGK